MRLIALIDGFNVYHSLAAAEREIAAADDLQRQFGKPLQPLQGRRFRWFDIPGFLRSRLPAVSRDAKIVRSLYFSAYAYHAGEERVRRHQLYVKALKGFGVEEVMSEFKDKEMRCPCCKADFTRKEEKETDVALACALIEAALNPDLDGYILFSGDTDQLPAIRLAQKLAPAKPLFVAFPFRRTPREMRSLARQAWHVDVASLDRFRWPKLLTLPDGTIIERPDTYDG